jgi:hypothetical protein
MNNNTQCPECIRHFSEHLIRFPMFLDDTDNPKTYMICPICAYERKVKQQGATEKVFLLEHSQKLYEEALIELKKSKEQNKGPIDSDKIQYKTLERLSPDEKSKVQKDLDKLKRN